MELSIHTRRWSNYIQEYSKLKRNHFGNSLISTRQFRLELRFLNFDLHIMLSLIKISKQNQSTSIKIEFLLGYILNYCSNAKSLICDTSNEHALTCTRDTCSYSHTAVKWNQWRWSIHTYSNGREHYSDS